MTATATASNQVVYVPLPSDDVETTNAVTDEAKMTRFQSSMAYILSMAAAIGTGLQNMLSLMAMAADIIRTGSITLKDWLHFAIQGGAIFTGGFCSSIVNFCMNIQLMRDFFDRVSGNLRQRKEKDPVTGELRVKEIAPLEGARRIRYWVGSVPFLITGILFGLTTVVMMLLTAQTPLLVACSVLGLFVAIVNTIQELETWLKSFDVSKAEVKSMGTIIKEWFTTMTIGRFLGTLLALITVFALSLTFTFVLAQTFAFIGFTGTAGLVVSAAISFTIAAFTELYFYNHFLADFGANFVEKMKQFAAAKHPVLGAIAVFCNALANGGLAFSGIFTLLTVTLAPYIVLPMTAVAVITAVLTFCAFAASWSLGMDFWRENSSKLMGYFIPGSEAGASAQTPAAVERKQVPGSALTAKEVNANNDWLAKNESAFNEAVKKVSSSITGALEAMRRVGSSTLPRPAFAEARSEVGQLERPKLVRTMSCHQLGMFAGASDQNAATTTATTSSLGMGAPQSK